MHDVDRVKIAESQTEIVDHSASIFLTVLTRLGDCIEQISALYVASTHSFIIIIIIIIGLMYRVDQRK